MGRSRGASPCGSLSVYLGVNGNKSKANDPTENTSLLGEPVVMEDSQTPPDHSVDTETSGVCLGVRAWWRDISVPTYVFVCMFGLSSWIDINGLFVELPLLVEELPEGWNLPSYLSMIIQIANVGPLIYTVLHYWAPHRVYEWPVIYLILVTGTASCLLLAFLWDKTMMVAGVEHSVSLFVMVGLLALVDCTSSVVYLPYMAAFKPQYLTALYIGEGGSGLLPGIAGLIQGLGGATSCINQTSINSTTNHTIYTLVPAPSEPLFSIESFFFMLFAIMCTSGIAFTLLHFLPMCKNERVRFGFLCPIMTAADSPEKSSLESKTANNHSICTPKKKKVPTATLR